MKKLLLLPLLFISVISFGQAPNYVPTDSLVIRIHEDSLSITNSHLIPVLVKAIQELSAKVTALESE